MMNTFSDCLALYDSDRKLYRNLDFSCTQGKIRFYDAPELDQVWIHFVRVDLELRRSGVWRRILPSFTLHTGLPTNGVIAVSSPEMYACLKKYFPQFADFGGDFIWN